MTDRSAWTEEGALRELVRMARELYDVDADEAWRRLGRLTEEQRRLVSAAIDEVLGARGD